ncbi:MAG: hypothetical protein M3277_10555 [Actinomycetota bacterium]|nr:hypothetical protein [Actinomycetota bacterium]
MAEGKQKKITQKITLDVFLTAPDGKVRRSHAGELRRLQRLGFRETDRRIGNREDHVRVVLEREVDRYPGVPVPGVHPYID